MLTLALPPACHKYLTRPKHRTTEPLRLCDTEVLFIAAIVVSLYGTVIVGSVTRVFGVDTQPDVEIFPSLVGGSARSTWAASGMRARRPVLTGSRAACRPTSGSCAGCPQLGLPDRFMPASTW